MIVSSIPWKIFFNNKFFVIQQKAAEKKIKLTNFKSPKLFKYSEDSEILTGQIEKLTDYKKRN